MSADDFFDDVLNLEEQYYQEGYDEGLKDGVEAGKIEGRSVGLKSGFEKFLEAGKLQGRVLVWANRTPSLLSDNGGGIDGSAAKPAGDNVKTTTEGRRSLPPLPSANARLEKNIVTLYGLLEPGTLSTQNDDDAVNDLDSRLKGAQGKAKIIDRVIGEKVNLPGTNAATPSPISGPKNENIEDVGKIQKGPTDRSQETGL